MRKADRLDAILGYVARIDAGVDEPLPADLLAQPYSLYEFAKQWRVRAAARGGAPAPPALAPGYLSPERLYLPQRRAISVALGYFISGGDARFVEKPKLAPTAPVEDAPPKELAKLGARKIAHAVDEPLFQLQSLPCGIGKTAILWWISILTGRTACVITRSSSLAVDFVRMVLHDTGTEHYAPVYLLRAHCSSEKKPELPDHNILSDVDVGAFKTHLLENRIGIVVADIYMGQAFDNASAARTKMQRIAHSLCWDVLALDEFDALMSEQSRRTLLDGLEAEALPEDCEIDGVHAVSTKRRYPISYQNAIGMSGTLERTDGAEQRVREMAPITYSVRAIELEQQGFLAPSVLRVVRCALPDSPEFTWVAESVRAIERPEACPSKYAMLDQLVGFFCGFLSLKVMVFGESKHVFAPAEGLFPHGVNIIGDSHTDGLRAAAVRQFKARVSADQLPLWNTTQVCSVGADFDDCKVVVLLHTHGSANMMRQRMGRATRVCERRKDGTSKTHCYMFQLVGRNEEGAECIRARAPGPMDAPPLLPKGSADIYERFFDDGMAYKLLLVDDHALVAKMKAYVMNVGCVYSGERVDGGGDGMPLERVVATTMLDAAPGKNDAVLYHMVQQTLHKALATKHKSCPKAFKKVFHSNRLFREKTEARAANDAQAAERRYAAECVKVKASRYRALATGRHLPALPTRPTASSAGSSNGSAGVWTATSRFPPPELDPLQNCCIGTPKSQQPSKGHGKRAHETVEPPPLLLDALVHLFKAAGRPVERDAQAVWTEVCDLRDRVEVARDAWNAEREGWRKGLLEVINTMMQCAEEGAELPLIGEEVKFLLDEQPQAPAESAP